MKVAAYLKRLVVGVSVFLFAGSAQATFIGQDIDVLLTVGSSTVINETVSVNAPSSVSSGALDFVSYTVIMPGVPLNDSSFLLRAERFLGSQFTVSDVVLTISGLGAIGDVIGVTEYWNSSAGTVSFTDTSVNVSWDLLGVLGGGDQSQFIVEFAETTVVSAPGGFALLCASAVVLGFRRRRRNR